MWAGWSRAYARDAMAGEGRLTIAARPCAPGERPTLKPGAYICLSVADTGTGMGAETLRRAREPFFTTKGVGQGDDAGLVRATADATPVLLVDEEELVRAGTADMLSGAGYSVTQASSGYQALELLRSGHPTEVLIADCAMPGMTGVDLAHEARALRPGLRVLLITGYATVADGEAGGLPRLAKPFRVAHLAAAVADLLRAR